MRTLWWLGLLSVACQVDAPPPAVPVSSAAQSTSLVPPHQERLGSPITINGRRFHIHATQQEHGVDATLVQLVIRDDSGRIHFEQRFDTVAIVENMLESTVEYWPEVRRTPHGDVLLLYYEYSPSAPGTGTVLRILGLVDGSLSQLSPPLSVAGGFNHDRVTSHGLLDVEVAQGRFIATVPFLIDLQGCTAASDRNCVLPHGERSLGHLMLLRVSGDLRPVEAPDSVELFAAPDASVLRTMTVGPASKVKLIEAAAQPYLLKESGYVEVRIRGEWLHVEIDGQTGWIRGDESFAAIGLPAVG